MKILLLRVPTSNKISADGTDIFDEDVGVYQPLGLLYLYSSLRHARPKDQVKIIDCQVENTDHNALQDKLLDFNPDIIGITALTFRLPEIYACLENIKRCLPNTITALGGPHAELFPNELLINRNVDYVITGEGEYSFPEFVSCIETGKSPSEVQGIHYLDKDGNKVEGKETKSIKTLDDLPPLDYDALKMDRYYSVMDGKNTCIMLTSRGCPYRCVYCDRPNMGNVYRAKSAKRVIEEIRNIMDYGIDNIQIFDDTFTVNKSRVFEICNLIAENRIKISFFLRARVNTINEELLCALKEAGCKRISFGVEAGSDRMLKALKKNIKISEVQEAFKLCKKTGIDTLADFIIGGPDQTRADVEDTIKFAIKLNPDYVQFSIMTPYPGTELYTMGMERGLIKDDYWREYAKNPTEDFETPKWEEHLSRKELQDMFSDAYRRFYRRPKFIIREVLKVRSLREFYHKARLGIKTLSIKPG